MDISESVTNLFLKEGILGGIIIVQSIVIAYLFRKVMAQHDLRVNELKEEAKAHEAATREMVTVVTTNNGVLTDVRSHLTALLGKR